MAAEAPILVQQLTVLSSAGATALVGTALGIEVIAMGDRTGYFLVYDRGQAGSAKPTTLYAQLVHFDGSTITAGPQFAWDALTHSMWRPGSVYQNYSHKIVGISATVAIRFWFQTSGSDVVIRAQRIDFSGGINAAPTVTELGAITGEPSSGTSAASFWAQRTREGAAAVYWTTADTGSIAVHVDGFLDSPARWTRLTPDPIIATGASTGLMPYYNGSSIAGDEAYFAGFQPGPYSAAAVDVIVAMPGGSVQESARRVQPADYTLPQEALTGLSDGIGITPGSASFTVDTVAGDQIIGLHLWSRFTIIENKEINVTEVTPYSGATLVAASVYAYAPYKQASTSEVMFLGTWNDHDVHIVADYINHARFADSPRGTLNVTGHRQMMRSKTGVPT